jgi:hypothetical protein
MWSTTTPKFVDLKVMSATEKGADARHPLVACQRHSQGEIEAALARSGRSRQEDD